MRVYTTASCERMRNFNLQSDTTPSLMYSQDDARTPDQLEIGCVMLSDSADNRACLGLGIISCEDSTGAAMIRDGQACFPHPAINTSPAPIRTCHRSHGTS